MQVLHKSPLSSYEGVTIQVAITKRKQHQKPKVTQKRDLPPRIRGDDKLCACNALERHQCVV